MDKTQFNPQDPNALFSPDQWLNRFSNYNNAPLPWPSTFYTGTPAGSMPPTDAMGKPIQSFLDAQKAHDAWRAPASAPSSAPMGTDPNFGLENQWLSQNNQPVQLAPTQTPGQLGPQTQAALQAMMGQNQSPSGLGQGASGAQGAQTVPGTTLNSTPQSQPQPSAQGQGQTIADMVKGAAAGGPGADFSKASNSVSPMMDQLAGWQALQYPTLAAGGDTYGDAYLNQISKGYGGGRQQGGVSSTAPANPFDMHQAYLDALSNPGKVTTPGATVPQSASVQPGPANLQSFLANWKPAQSGPGSGFQMNFANALKGMGY